MVTKDDERTLMRKKDNKIQLLGREMMVIDSVFKSLTIETEKQ